MLESDMFLVAAGGDITLAIAVHAPASATQIINGRKTWRFTFANARE
jgi:hypothetical protein